MKGAQTVCIPLLRSRMGWWLSVGILCRKVRAQLVEHAQAVYVTALGSIMSRCAAMVTMPGAKACRRAQIVKRTETVCVPIFSSPMSRCASRAIHCRETRCCT